jgi:hypothetical protein
MKYILQLTIVLMATFARSVSCGSKNGHMNKSDSNDDMAIGKITIRIDAKTFTASLMDNPSAASFRAMLPVTLNMIELNGNEKYCALPESLPTAATNPGTIRNGDLMLYGSNTLVLFYKTFSTSYSYTKLGTVDDPEGLAKELGSKNITVSFSTE